MRNAALLTIVLALISGPAIAQQIDGSGLSEELREQLLIAPEWDDTLEIIAEDAVGDVRGDNNGRYDIARVHFANVAQGRWLWAIEFAEPYRFENASLILYVDADNNPETGREGMGCETTYGHSEGRPTQMFYLPDDRRDEFPPPRIGLEDGILFICADLELNQEDDRSVYRIQVLSEQREPHESRDSLGWREVSGPGDTDRERVLTLADIEQGEGFEVTQDMALLWDIHADERNVIINSFQDCRAEGYDYYHSEYRWPAMRRTANEGTLSARATAGHWHLGVVVYDTAGREVYELSIDDEPVGIFIADEENRRQRLFFTPEPIELRGNERITLRAGGHGMSVVEDIILLAERPEQRQPAKRLEHLEVGWDWDREVMRATWITTWPVACTLTVAGQEIAGEEPLQNHRAYLPELEAGREYELTVDAAEAGEHTIRFTAGEPEVPPGTVSRDSIELGVLNEDRPLPEGYPLTAGIPFPEGALASTDQMRLLVDGAEHPLQARPIVRWPDGRVKVALLDTAAPANAETMTLEFGREVSRSEITSPLRLSHDGDALTVSTAHLSASFDLQQSGLFTRLERNGEALTDPNRPARITLVDDEGNAYDTLGTPDEVVVEEDGPMRAVIRLDGNHTGAAGEFFNYRIRLAFFADYPAVQVTYRWMNNRSGPEFSEFNSIRFELPLAADDAEVLIGADEPVAATLADSIGIAQLRDESYSATVGRGPVPRHAPAAGERAPGWVSADDITLACGDFWQLYPKGIGVDEGALYVDICPDFADGEYDDCTERELYKLYYYLQNGVYKIRQGMAKTHDLWIDVNAADGNTLATLAGEPPVLLASPEWYRDSRVFGDFVPVTTGSTPRFDDVCDHILRSYLSRREAVKEYGMINYGDQWGERGANWFNGEYDHHHTAAQMVVRGHEPFAWHQLMRNMARHDNDVDLCHFHDNERFIGGSWTHAIGHVGSYIDERMEGEHGSPRAGQSTGHTWTRGTTEHFMLTGDPAAIEAARMITARYGTWYLNNYDFTNARIPGWHLIFTVATYQATGDPFYLNAGRIIVDRVMERRTPGSGWDRQMVPGHCHCEPRCRGLCSFMQGVLGVGLRDYWLATGDQRVAEAVPEAARHVIDEIWVGEVDMWRYTSCPDSSLRASRAAVMAGLMLFAWEISDDPIFPEVTVRSMNLGFDVLRALAHARWAPYIVYSLDRLHRLQEPGFGGEREGTFVLRNDEEGTFQVHVFDREGRPAPSDAAQMIGPGGDTWRPAEDGRIVVENAPEGIYRLRLARDSGPWQVTSSVNRIVAHLGGGLELDLPEGVTRVMLWAEEDGARAIDCTVLDGNPSWRLLGPDGREMDPAEARAGEFHALELRGPGQVRISIRDGWSEWAALYEGRWFNASAPTVQIEGTEAFAPGEGRRMRLSAVVQHFHRDVRRVRWLLPDGREVEGEQIEFEAPPDVTEVTVRAIAEDGAGNSDEASITVTFPDPALGDFDGAITVQADDFSAQGGGEVLITERIGSVGRMITMWHEHLGHWLEWVFDVPADGEYSILARYATGSAEALRSLTIDGESPGKAFGELRFEGTGGFSTAEDNWAFKRLGEPVQLAAGERTIRMANLGGGLALDYITLIPAKAGANDA